jgi:GT2 family glycosyltransferase
MPDPDVQAGDVAAGRTQLRPIMHAGQPLVSIIVVTFNGAEHIESCLAAIDRQSYPCTELIVVDNASRDSSAELVERFPGALLLRSRRNLGFAGACNVGVRHANGSILFFVNQDAVLDPSCLRALVDAMLLDPRIGIAGCKIYDADGVTLQHAGGVLAPNGLSRHTGRGERDRGQYDEITDPPYVTGAALAVRREVFERCGCFDEKYFPAYFEETELCFRVREAGYRVVYVPHATLTHREASSSGNSHSKAYRLAYHRNRLRFIINTRSPKQLLTEFVPAELRWLARHAPPADWLPLLHAYAQALAAVAGRLARVDGA